MLRVLKLNPHQRTPTRAHFRPPDVVASMLLIICNWGGVFFPDPFFMTNSLRGCVVEAVPPRRQPLPAGQTAHRCVFSCSDPGIEKLGYALADLPAAGSSLMTWSSHKHTTPYHTIPHHTISICVCVILAQGPC